MTWHHHDVETDTPEPSDELRAAAARRLRAVAELDAAQRDLAAQIRTDAARGVRQVDIVKVTEYAREQVRRICRAGPSEATQ